MPEKAWNAICQFILRVRSFMGDINDWLLSHHWTMEIYAVIGIILLVCVCLYQKFPHRWHIQFGILLMASLLCLCIFSIFPLLMLVRVAVGFALLLGLFHAGFRQKAAQYQRPNQEEDFLGRRLFYKRGVHQIRQMLQRCWDANGLAIAVYGSWGSGKSHFLRYLERNLCVIEAESDVTPSNGFQGKCRIAKVDLWQCHTLAEAWEQIAVVLCEAITGKRSHISHTSVTKSFLKGISAINENLTPFVYIVSNFLYGGEDYQSSVTSMNMILNKQRNDAVVLFLDNVERCDMEIILQLLPLMERLKQIHHLVVIAAIAKEELREKFVSHGYNEEYLDGVLYKLFDNTMYLPECKNINLGDMFRNIAERYHSDCPTLMKYIKRHHDFSCSSPRDVERIVNHLAYIDYQYLARFSNCLEDKEWLSRCDCVFKMEIVRMNHSHCYQFLKETPAVWRFLKHVPYPILIPDWNRMSLEMENKETKLSEKEALWKKEHAEFMNLIDNDATVKDYLHYFSRQKEEDFIYALNKSYFYLDELGDTECDEIIELAINGKEQGIKTIPEAIDRLYGDCRDIEKRQIIIQSVMRAVRKTDNQTAREFVSRAVHTCYKKLEGMNYTEFYPFLIYNVAKDDKWKQIEDLVLPILSYHQINEVLEQAFTLLMIHKDSEFKDADIREYGYCLSNDFSLLKGLCCKYMSCLLKRIIDTKEIQDDINRHACNIDFKFRGMPYYDKVIKNETRNLIKNIDKIDILRRLIFSLYYWRQTPFDIKKKKMLLFSEAYYKIILSIMGEAGLLYESIKDDGELMAQVKQEIQSLLPDIREYNDNYVRNKPEDELNKSYARAGKQAQDFFVDYLSKIEQAEQDAQGTHDVQVDT